MEKILLVRQLEKYPVFNLKKIGEITGKTKGYAKLLVYRLKKKGIITEIEKNKFTTNNDPMVIASNMIWPSYISCWSALRYYNLTEQLPQDIFVITTKTRKKRIVKFNNIKIIFIRVKPKYFFGYIKERYNNFDIFIAEKEKALIDSALFKKISFSEICNIIKNNLDILDTRLFLDYLIKIKNKTLIKRFGFLFDKLNMGVYKKIKRFIDSKYVVLDYALPAKGKKDRKWAVIENAKP